METTCLKIISWLENSGYLPDDASYDIECARENIGDSIQDFQKALTLLSDADFSEPRVFGEQLVKVLGYTESLSTDIQDLERALLKTMVSLPDGLFEHGAS